MFHAPISNRLDFNMEPVFLHHIPLYYGVACNIVHYLTMDDVQISATVFPGLVEFVQKLQEKKTKLLQLAAQMYHNSRLYDHEIAMSIASANRVRAALYSTQPHSIRMHIGEFLHLQREDDILFLEKTLFVNLLPAELESISSHFDILLFWQNTHVVALVREDGPCSLPHLIQMLEICGAPQSTVSYFQAQRDTEA